MKTLQEFQIISNALRAEKAVFLLDDDVSSVRYVEMVLRRASYKVCGFSEVSPFIESCTDAACVCVLLDMQLPDTSGLAIQQVLSERGVKAPVLFLTGHADVATTVAAMKNGAVDLIEKPVAPEELIRRVQMAIDVDAPAVVVRAWRAHLLKRWQNLSSREQEVYHHVATGEANKNIAKTLQICERTVEVHRSRVMAKMGAASLAELVGAYKVCQ